MQLQNTFIAGSVIALRDGIAKLSQLAESRPRLPAGASAEQATLLTRFHDLQLRLGGVLNAYEMDIERMLGEL